MTIFSDDVQLVISVLGSEGLEAESPAGDDDFLYKLFKNNEIVGEGLDIQSMWADAVHRLPRQ
jgi:hypothetical protein